MSALTHPILGKKVYLNFSYYFGMGESTQTLNQIPTKVYIFLYFPLFKFFFLERLFRNQ